MGNCRFPGKDGRIRSRCKYKFNTKEELLDYLRQFYEKYRRCPTMEDFTNNPEYPSFMTYVRLFGNWSDAIEIAGLDVFIGRCEHTDEKPMELLKEYTDEELSKNKRREKYTDDELLNFLKM